MILRLKYFLRKNKINTCSEEGLTNGRSPEFSGAKVRVSRPKTPWGDAWWNDINHKIDSGPNNILPPLNTNLPTLRLEPLPPVTMKRGKKPKGVVRLKGDMDASKRNSIFSKDVTTLLKERLSRQRNSLPDIRNGFNTQFSSPLVAWQKLLHSQKMEKDSDDLDRSSSNSEETDDTKQADVVEVLTTDSYACSESSPRDEDDELLSNVFSTDKDSGNPGQNMEDKDLPSFGEDETKWKEGKLITSIAETDGLTMTNDTKNSTQKIKTTTGLDSNLSDVSDDAENRAGEIPDQKPDCKITRKNKTRKKKTLHQSKTRKQENEKLSKDSQQIDLNSESLTRQGQNSVSTTTKQEEDIFENVNLINVIIVVILINFIISLPKVFLDVYLAFCSDCSISFHVFHSLRLIDDAGRILSPFFIVVFHGSFRLIMVYFLTCTKCKSRAVRND
ncbi:hypothetical protein SNE40_017843 [Patella caerulea]|uniref:Uncharacterized protein n=1 Tax=Patella caerulea TaxID=87958 RepID=A0AAN8JB76_PATCE